MDSVATLAGVPNTEFFTKVDKLEKEYSGLKNAVDHLSNLFKSLQARVEALESGISSQVSNVPITIVISIQTSSLCQYMNTSKLPQTTL